MYKCQLHTTSIIMRHKSMLTKRNIEGKEGDRTSRGPVNSQRQEREKEMWKGKVVSIFCFYNKIPRTR